jgi:hypothetical protein
LQPKKIINLKYRRSKFSAGSAGKTYNAAADHYDHSALSFWDRFGRRTVAVAALSAPDRERVRG